MPEAKKALSQLRRARIFLGLAIGIGFASIVYWSVDSDANLPAIAVIAISLTWALLSLFAVRGYNFARWGLALGVAAMVASPSIILFPWLLSLSSTPWAEGGSYVENYLALAVAVLGWISVLGLVFSESVGDYFSRRGASSLLWQEILLTPGANWRNATPDSIPSEAGILYRTTLVARVRAWIRYAFIFSSLLAVLGVAVTVWKIRSDTARAQNQVYSETSPKKDAGDLTIMADFFLRLMETVAIIVWAILGVTLAVVGIYLAFFVLPFLITLPITLPFARSWAAPLRFLLLRPFGSPLVSRNLRQFLHRELFPLGHCYTLADAAIRIPWQVRIPFLLGQLALFRFRVRKIRRPRDLQRLAREINRRVMRNLNWALATDPFFPITCSDDAWQACVRAIVDRVDVVLMDVTVLKPNMLWELDLLRSSGATARTILLVQENSRAELAQQLRAHADVLAAVPLVAYGDVAAAGVLTKAVTSQLGMN